MNNGKVRIYELSKELNLENKDILGVCKRLNISVKSHSSTITESEAELIRTTAENLPHSPSQSAAPEKSDSQNQDSGSNHNEQKKQQILEVRKPKPLVEKFQQKNHSKINNNLVATPPNTSVLNNQIQPVGSSRPNSSLNSETLKDRSDLEVSDNSSMQHPNRPLNKGNTVEKNNSPEKTDSTEMVTAEVPKLVAPPARPAPPSLNRNARNTNINKPNQKNKKPKQEGKKRKDKEEKPFEKPAIAPKKENKDTPLEKPTIVSKKENKDTSHKR
ncbi:MAG: translation initiation factor IF-2 N-terminal domain-containing protein, partial [Trichodesmium sp. St16_bin2-tuft]|nr:translation initiation factor IF-2 N-terminal domain-containing protein [Trichodesmium sp. St16_bin2-tuft]